ncbi:hypothetical protein FHR81_004213 [Actinoalloteichus hoggarensis]|uniref:hypothetical protein n=1 Tax=Actinoalloteichus hoggarensis TaxID=1470176 RepID=UPI000B8B0E92|nr:hypothetical protein [Actinoalloteichus hoggarensis]MBB5923146.1 hypothetical protein [Actinoalloteichus hoggarensis]
MTSETPEGRRPAEPDDAHGRLDTTGLDEEGRAARSRTGGSSTDVDSTDEGRAWWVACHDPFGRDRSVTVLVDGGEIAVISPPGAGAVMSARQTRRLRSTLDRAARTAGSRRP